MGMKVSLKQLQTVLLAGVIPGLASAATPVTFHNKAIQPLHGLSISQNVRLLTSHQDLHHTTHKRYQQHYQGVDVIGGYVIKHVKANQSLASWTQAKMTGTLYKNIDGDLGRKPTMAKGQKIVDSAISNYYKAAVADKKIKLVVYIDKSNKAHWAYQYSFLVKENGHMPKKPSAIIDAITLKPYVTWDDIKTARHDAVGLGFGGNELIGQYEYGKDLPSLHITRDDATNTCYLGNDDVKVVDLLREDSYENNPADFPCEAAVADNTYMTGSEGSGYNKKNGAYSPENDALYTGHVIQFMYRDWYKVNALVNPDGSPMQLIMRVHFAGDVFENAFWDGKEMTFGDGGSHLYPLVTLGVAAHEVSHGFTQQHSDLQYYGQSGGLNESFSDMAAQAALFYSDGDNSWMIGDRIMRPSTGRKAMRYMDQPSLDGRSIDSADQYTDELDVHYSSGVFNRLFYLLATSDNWTTRKAFDVMVKANQDYWTPNATFETAACGVLYAAQDYADKDVSYDLASVRNAINEVKIDVSQCH